MRQIIRSAFDEAEKLVSGFIGHPPNLEKIAEASRRLASVLMNGGKAIACGNGGSMCDAMHFAEELTARFKTNRVSLPAVAVCDPSHISCTANDFGYEFVFSRYVEGMGNPGDLLLAVSTSGNSPNVVKAVETAKAKGMFSVGLLGKNGGKLKSLCDLPIVVEHPKTERVQEIHVKVIHSLIETVELLLEKENYIELPSV